MPTRTIYTTSEVHIGGSGTVLGSAHIVSAVTSATFTQDTPREQVTVFGKKGQVATVQNESTTSTIEIVFHPYTSTSGLEGPDPSEANSLYFEPGDLNSLMTDSAKDVPTGETILVKGVGKLDNALLTSVTAEGSVGALPTITLAFDGRGTTDSTSVTADTASYSIANMENVNLHAGSGNTSAYAQSATFNWEMPIEKLNRLGDSVESAWTYGTPPGTASIAVEGTDNAGKITSVNFGQWRLSLDSDAQVSNTTNNMAVGELGATYNTTTEGVADGCVSAVNS